MSNLEETKAQILQVIEEEFSNVDNVEIFIERVKGAETPEAITETIQLLETQSKATKKAYSDDPWVDLLIRVQKDEALTEVFPHLKGIDPSKDLGKAEEQLGSIMCLSFPDDSHTFLNPATLEYDYTVGSTKVASTTMTQARDNYREYFNVGISQESIKQDTEGNVTTKKRSKADLYDIHVRPVGKVIKNLAATSTGTKLERAKGQLVAHESGIEIVPAMPRHHQVCEDWLKLLTGDAYNDVVTWVAHSTDFSKALPILSVLGAPNTGKSLLAKAITDLIEFSESPISPDDLFEGQFNGEVGSTPFVVADDGGLDMVNEDLHKSVDHLKQFLSKSQWTVNPKFGKKYSLLGYLRCYCAFNHDKDKIKKLFVGSTSDNESLGQRILHYDVPAESLKDLAQMFETLDVYGEEDPANRWLGIEGKLTEHVLYLIENKADYPLPSINGRWGNMVDYVYEGSKELSKTELRCQNLLYQVLADAPNNTKGFEGVEHYTVSASQIVERDSKGFVNNLEVTAFLKTLKGTFKRKSNGRNQWFIPTELIDQDVLADFK